MCVHPEIYLKMGDLWVPRFCFFESILFFYPAKKPWRFTRQNKKAVARSNLPRPFTYDG